VAKLIKEGGKELKKVIFELILKIWEDVIPQEWNYGMIFPIHKKVGGGGGAWGGDWEKKRRRPMT